MRQSISIEQHPCDDTRASGETWTGWCSTDPCCGQAIDCLHTRGGILSFVRQPTLFGDCRSVCSGNKIRGMLTKTTFISFPEMSKIICVAIASLPEEGGVLSCYTPSNLITNTKHQASLVVVGRLRRRTPWGGWLAKSRLLHAFSRMCKIIRHIAIGAQPHTFHQIQ